jgi:hypothetical protein
LNTPVWVGESGEKGNTIYWGTTQYFEAHNIGWSFWPWKKMDTRNTPYSINKPEGWDEIISFTRDQTALSRETALKAFNQLLENIRIENCVYFPDVVNAIFRRVPGKVEAENYGHRGLNRSYFVKDTTRLSKFYRLSEPVQIDRMGANEPNHHSEQYIILNTGEWTAYEINNLQPATYTTAIKIKAEEIPAEMILSLNGQEQSVRVDHAGWNDVVLPDSEFPSGANLLKLHVMKGVLSIDWIIIN